MITNAATPDELIASLRQVNEEIISLVSELSHEQFNEVPYPGSWTSGQLLRHVSKSAQAVGQTIREKGKPAGRDPKAGIQELKDTFLSTTNKFESPDFIVPEDKIYDKETSIQQIEQAFDTIKTNAKTADLDELRDDLPVGPVTKIELLHFVLYHTQRHLNQLKRIVAALQ